MEIIKLFKKIIYSKKYEYEEIIYEILTKNFNEYRIEELNDNNNNNNNIKGFMIVSI